METVLADCCPVAANAAADGLDGRNSGKGRGVAEHFTADHQAPYAALEWERRTAVIANEKGEVLFEQKDVEVPADWSQTATNIVASKYFHGRLGSPERESRVAQLVQRVVDTITAWGERDGYFASREAAEVFRDELAHLVLTQKASFNSPVWFNVGVRETRGYGWCWDASSGAVEKLTGGMSRPQCSACFILSVEDSLESVLGQAKTEGMLFKWGSGTGTNFSRLREEGAALSGGGRASGPLSFMRGFDAFAGVIKSGGKTRRAAKMVILNAEHPDIEKFVWCKAKEEKKARVLIEAGYDPSLDGEAYSSVFFQNANNSVRVTDEFMQAAVEDRDWWTRSVLTGEPVRRTSARGFLRQIAEATHQCGDPGMQFDSTVNRWHTCKASGRINGSNPCSEYMFLDDSSCNLSSLNLLKFLDSEGMFDVAAFRHAVELLIVAQEILIDNASYPTEKIARNSHEFRPLGLGFSNLGALLMALGLPYDSDGGRSYAAAVAAIMSGQAYLTSARMAHVLGPFTRYRENEAPFLDVMRMHREAVDRIAFGGAPAILQEAARSCWDEAIECGIRVGFRNAQVTAIAPTGTIGFMMDCDTTGIEPELALIKYKKLVGGGTIKIVNRTVSQALDRLGYARNQVGQIIAHLDATGSIEGAPGLSSEQLAVFDCSLRPQNGARCIHHTGHIRMLAAVQPFISGAISKTINMPEESTVEDIMGAYIDAWKLGLKAVAIYRDGSKKVQPLSTSGGPDATPSRGSTVAQATSQLPSGPVRRKLPDERRALTHKFSIAGHEGYITVGMYDDGTPGEIFITTAKEGSTISGLMDSLATGISFALQYGVPLKFLVDKFSHMRFEPSGWTGNSQIPYAKSIVDYIFRWLGARFLDPEYAVTDVGCAPALRPTEPDPQQTLAFDVASGDALTCSECGSIMTRSGSCYRCPNCGCTSGCS